MSATCSTAGRITRSTNRGASLRRGPAVALLVAAVLAVSACSSEDGDAASGSDPNAPVATDTAVTAVEHLEPKAFAERMSQPGVVLLDVRTPAEYADGHIAKAQNLDVQAKDFTKRLASLDKAAGYAIYCRSGVRSNAAAQQMHNSGFGRIADLAGGINAWTAAGNPLTGS